MKEGVEPVLREMKTKSPSSDSRSIYPSDPSHEDHQSFSSTSTDESDPDLLHTQPSDADL